MMHCFVSVVVPVYNGASTLDELTQRLEAALTIYDQYEIIYVDDASPDDSAPRIQQLCQHHPSIIGIVLEHNIGQQRATQLGIRAAKGDYIVTIDDDLGQQPEDIPYLIETIQTGYDAVYGIPGAFGHQNAFRGWGGRIRNWVFNHITHKPKDIKVSSFRVLTRQAAAWITAANTAYVYLSMELLQHTLHIGNVTVDYGAGRVSNYTTGRLIRLITDMIVYYHPGRFFRPFRKTAPSPVIRWSNQEDNACAS